MSSVVVKGEYHSSGGDLAEEKELLNQGFDVLVLEGREREAECRLSDGWFGIAIATLFWLAGRIYVSKDSLVDLAEVQGTEVVYTRESNVELVENTPNSMKLLSAVMFCTLAVGSVVVGLTVADTWGAAVLFLALFSPVLGIRIVNSRESRGDLNRDKIVADKIADAAASDQRVLAIVGDAHVDGVTEHLPPDVDPIVCRPAYSRADWRHVREIALPVFEMALLLYSLYVLLSWILLRLMQFALLVM